MLFEKAAEIIDVLKAASGCHLPKGTGISEQVVLGVPKTDLIPIFQGTHVKHLLKQAAEMSDAQTAELRKVAERDGIPKMTVDVFLGGENRTVRAGIHAENQGFLNEIPQQGIKGGYGIHLKSKMLVLPYTAQGGEPTLIGGGVLRGEKKHGVLQ